MWKPIFTSLCLLAPVSLHAQAGCAGEPFRDSSPRATSLSKFTPASRQGGVVFHSWLDTGRSQPRAHLVVENSNAYPVAVRYRVELRGSRGPMNHGERCVTIRAHEYAVDTGGNTVFAYHPSPLWGIEVGDVRITSLRPPAAPREEAAPRAPVVPVSPAATRTAPPRSATPAPARAQAEERAPPPVADTVPVRAAAAPLAEAAGDTAPAASVAAAERPAPDTARSVPDTASPAVLRTSARPRAERPVRDAVSTAARREPRMTIAATVLKIAFGTLLTAAGTMLLVAVAGAIFLLVVRGALHGVRRALPSRADGG